uniref:Transmembrane protein n=1 Tax=Gerbil paramyxovirus TaxID=2942127 RepID=A0A977NV78_9MONO|nr:transmembrane protein [Gerbil paramyxovirus]
MTSVYEEPPSLTNTYIRSRPTPPTPYYRSCKGLLTRDQTTYKSVSSRYSSIRSKRGRDLLLIIILIVSTVNISLSCYLIISFESKSLFEFTKKEQNIGDKIGDKLEEINRIGSSINNVMHSVTYTLPHLISSSRQSTLIRINELASEIRDIIKMQALEFSMRMSNNRTVYIKRGSSDTSVANPDIKTKNSAPTMPPVYPTLVPKVNYPNIPDLPLTNYDINRRMKMNREYEPTHDYILTHRDGDLYHDVANMNPT